MVNNNQVTKTISLEEYGIKNAKVNYQLSPNQLHDIAIEKGQGKEASSGALAVNTGEFTGRSPMDRFIVKDTITEDKVWWGKINIPFESDKFQKLYDKGYLSIINNVGYPNPNRSHFRSTDIWQTASDSNEFLQNGWVGRYLDFIKGNPYTAIEVDESLSLMMKGKTQNGLAITDSKMFYNSMKAPFFNNVVSNYNDAHLSEHNLGYLYNTMIDAKSSAKHIYEKTKTKNSSAEYPKNLFGKQLKNISQFINSGLETQVYYAGLSGFDTHANQTNTQARLLNLYAETMEVFINDLQKIFFILTLMIAIANGFSQTIKFQGKVLDTLQQPLVYANLIAEPNEDIAMRFAFTDEKGRFQLKLQKGKTEGLHEGQSKC